MNSIDFSGTCGIEKIMDMLAELECETYHACSDNPDEKWLREVNSSVRNAMKIFFENTHCILGGY